MKYSTVTLFCAMLMGGPVFAAPTTQPTDLIAVPQPALLTPAIEPAAAPGAIVPAKAGAILVLPLQESSGNAYPWVGKAIQQDLVAELTRTTRARIEAFSGAPVADNDAALAAGKQAGASLVIYGQFHSVSGQLRFTGQVLDIATGSPIGGFTATGQAADLFPLEDAITGQVLRTLPAGWVTVVLPPEPSTGSAGGGELSAPRPNPPQQPTGYYSYTYPDYSAAPGTAYGYYDWGYPYYWYSYPYYGPDIVFFGGFDRFHHHFWGGRSFYGDRGSYGRPYGQFHGGVPFHSNIPQGFSHSPSFHSEGGGHFGGGGGGGSHGGGGGGGGGHR